MIRNERYPSFLPNSVAYTFHAFHFGGSLENDLPECQEPDDGISVGPIIRC
jgi:hypothetical protein